ncbi:MAG: ChbG/HpnK family deacetylase [Solobacterium sp.]|nr:ChbG/HpnK family deacetylase [Solobacterium sp.]
MNLLIRADDLGFSEAVNLGIAKTVKEGLIRNIGLMTNMPYSQHGYDLIKDNTVSLGLHTNISTGKPLLPAEQIPSICDETGKFKSSREYRSAIEDFVNLEEVTAEIEAQYEAFRAITGRDPDYFEGHAVASQNFFRGLETVAERHGLRYLPFMMGSSVTFGAARLFVEMDSMKPDYDPYKTLERIIHTEYDGIPVMVCHPGFLDAYLLSNSSLTHARAYETEMLCDPASAALLKKHDVTLVTYSEIYE